VKGAGREQRGGAAILVAFMLLALMTGAAFGTSRNLVRELAMCADQVHGAQAAAAAEAGLAWFLDWAAGDPPGCRSILGAEGDSGEERSLPAPPGLPLVRPDAGPRQSFELRIRCLGVLPAPAPEGAGPGPGRLWLVRCAGRCAAGGQDPEGFTQIRELLVAAPVSGDPGGLRILAWWIGS